MGGRLQLPFLAPSQSAQKLWQSQSLNSGKTRKLLSNTRHTGPMKHAAARGWITSFLAVLTLTVWAFIIWMACYVSTIILQTLQQIVDLAAISP